MSVALALVVIQIGFPFALSMARDWPIYTGPAIVVFFVALNASPHVRLQGLGCALLLTLAATLLFGTRMQQAARQFAVMVEASSPAEADASLWLYLGIEFSVLMVGAWLLGFGIRMTIERFRLIRERSAAAETIRHAELKLVVAGERTRIARDLHDVLAHSLAVIAAQADGTRYLSNDQPPVVAAALKNISGAARSALIDAQRVIENLSHDAENGPGLAEIDGLIAQMRQGHLTIERTDQGTRQSLTSDQELAVYRVVQESLTNALKHAGLGSTATIRFNWDGPGLTLHITSTPSVQANVQRDRPAPGGRGISGLRDRVEASGGWLTAEPDEEAFITTAFIPYTDQNPASSGPNTSGATHG